MGDVWLLDFMAGKVFRAGCNYEWELLLRVGDIPEYKLVQLLKMDARVLGLLAQNILAERFDNLELHGSAKASYDLIEHRVLGGLGVWEIKTAGWNKAADLLPSYQKGANRSRNLDRLADLRGGLTGYIIMDLQRLPKVRIRGVPMSEIQLGQIRIPRETINLWFDGLWAETDNA